MGGAAECAGFPNFFIATNTVLCNYTVCAELIVDWTADCIGHLREQKWVCIAPAPEAEDAWLDHVNELAAGTILGDGDSWFMGANIPGKKRAVLDLPGRLHDMFHFYTRVMRASANFISFYSVYSFGPSMAYLHPRNISKGLR